MAQQTGGTAAKKTTSAPAAKKTASSSDAATTDASVGSVNAADAVSISDKDIKASQKPGNSPADSIPNPDTVPSLTSAHAGPMQGGDASRREEFVAASGPLSAPTDRELQTYPAAGYGLSSTDATFGAAGGRTVAGEQFDSLVGEDGKAITAASLFEDVDGKGYVIAKQRTFEQFYYPNTVEKAKRLLFVAGQKVARAEAARIKATLA